MRCIKNTALGCMIILFGILAGFVNHFMYVDTKENQQYDICVNEVCSDYFPTSFLETQPASDWIELYNPTNKSINLAEYYISDDKNDLYKCNLPSVDLMPGAYYVIHSEYNEMVEDEEKLNFRISAQGETLYLSSRTGVIDIVNVPALDTNTTWSRLADGEKEWGNTELTYSFSNNQAKQIQGTIDAPLFSAGGGFYAEEFELELTASPESKVFYTLDSSDPDEESILYEGPILVRDMSDEPNIFSVRDDFAVENEMATGDIDEKITIVRAIAVDKYGRKSDIITNSYIIGKKNDKRYTEMYTVSLVTDPGNVFDYNEGIYVLGKSFDDYVEAGGNLDDPMHAPANYRIHGKKSERPASIEIYDENGNLVADRDVGIRIHGGTTRGCTQKSFSVYAREMYDGEDTIDGLFGEGTAVHKFFIYTNRDWAKLRDALIAKMLEDRNVATQTFIYCNVFLDGEYWGIYLLAEIYDEYYFKNHYGIEMDNIQICEGAHPEDVMEYLYTVTDKSEEAVYEELCRMIDVQSFIDYYAAMLYLNDEDWLIGNARCYRSIEFGSGKNEDGKWRWGVWDAETTMYDAYTNTFHMGNLYSWEEDTIAQALMEHEGFRKQFIITYMDLYNNVWQDDNILPVISEMESNTEKSYEMHMERYNVEISTSEYRDKIKTFFIERPEYALEHLKEEFKLGTDPVWLIILSNKDGAASFRVNTSIIDMTESLWQGLYFPDYPVEIQIEEVYEDNEFIGWYTGEGELLSTDNMITLKLSEGENIICAGFVSDLDGK